VSTAHRALLSIQFEIRHITNVRTFSLKQRYGQPPQDIVNEIAPGLELDEDGMPKINPMEGMPFGGGNEECTIM
jgi:hypothetical protein